MYLIYKLFYKQSKYFSFSFLFLYLRDVSNWIICYQIKQSLNKKLNIVILGESMSLYLCRSLATLGDQFPASGAAGQLSPLSGPRLAVMCQLTPVSSRLLLWGGNWLKLVSSGTLTLEESKTFRIYQIYFKKVLQDRHFSWKS